MRILAIETSCDETSASVVEKNPDETSARVLTCETSSSVKEHATYGGIIPERAARKQIEYILPVVERALLPFAKDSTRAIKEHIHSIAVTSGPGLIGSLLVGVECAKTLSYIFGKPLIPVNHLLAHLYANFIEFDNAETEKREAIEFPFIGLIVSGGHTDLLLYKNHEKYEWIGGTRDDAVGEALDKIGRVLGLPYPGGPHIEKRAKNTASSQFSFRSPLLHSANYDFSYSGLKTEVARFVEKKGTLTEPEINQICYSVQEAAFDVLVKKTVRATIDTQAKSIVVGGGVAANERLREMFGKETINSHFKTKTFFPEKRYTLDNAAMIGTWALFHPDSTSWDEVRAEPEVYFA